jgi:hypothetical protein
MTTIHDEEGGPSGASSKVQFQVLSLFVWMGAFVLLFAGMKHARETHLSPPKLIMPVIHLVPWCVALVERRRIHKFLSLMPQGELLIQTAITRVLWVGYVTLALAEYWLY